MRGLEETLCVVDMASSGSSVSAVAALRSQGLVEGSAEETCGTARALLISCRVAIVGATWGAVEACDGSGRAVGTSAVRKGDKFGGI